MKRLVAILMTAVLAMVVPTAIAGSMRVSTLDISHEWSSISMGDQHCAAIAQGGNGYAWGFNYYGQTGNQLPVGNVPTPYNWGENAVSVVASASSTLMIDTDGTLWIWGKTYYGPGGTQPDTGVYSLIPVRLDTDVTQVAFGSAHGAYIKSDGTLWTWGENTFGGLGTGDYERSYTPQRILTDAAYVDVGDGVTAAIKNDGTLWAWGYNASGQVGNGSTSNRTTPVQVLTNVATVSVKGLHIAAIKNDGTLWTWGDNQYGQLGNGATANRTSPAQVMTDVAMVSAGFYHTGVIKTDGTLWFCGNNYRGAFGNGAVTGYSQANPDFTKTDGNYVAISCGYRVSCAITTDGRLNMAGENNYGQLGVGYVGDSTEGLFIPTFTPIALYLFDAEGDHTVTFVDWDGSVLSVQSVADGQAAAAPAEPTRAGYVFVGWDKDFSNVISDLTVTATYRLQGDMNNDGIITSSDALTLLRGAMGLTELSEEQTLAADVNQDGHITGADALAVLRLSLRLSKKS